MYLYIVRLMVVTTNSFCYLLNYLKISLTIIVSIDFMWIYACMYMVYVHIYIGVCIYIYVWIIGRIVCVYACVCIYMKDISWQQVFFSIALHHISWFFLRLHFNFNISSFYLLPPKPPCSLSNSFSLFSSIVISCIHIFYVLIYFQI